MVRTIYFMLAALAFGFELSPMASLACRAAATAASSKDAVLVLSRNMSGLSIRKMNPFKKECCVPDAAIDQAESSFVRAMLEFRNTLPTELRTEFKELQVSVFTALRQKSKQFCQRLYLDEVRGLTEAVTQSTYSAAVVQMGAFLVRAGTQNAAVMVKKILGFSANSACAISPAELDRALRTMRETVNECDVEQSVKDEFSAVIREWYDGQHADHVACKGHFLAVMDDAVQDCLRIYAKKVEAPRVLPTQESPSKAEKAASRLAQQYEQQRRHFNHKNKPFRRGNGRGR